MFKKNNKKKQNKKTVIRFCKYTYSVYTQVHLNKLECHGKVSVSFIFKSLIYFSNSTQIVKLVY